MKLNDRLQIIGMAGIIASLVFVGLEMRQSRQIAVADIYQQKTALLIEVQQFMRTTDGRTNAYALILSGQPLTPDDESTIRRSNPTWIAYWENNHFQYQLGMMTAEQWASSRNAMRAWFEFPGNQVWWVKQREIWRETFVVEVDGVISEIQESQKKVRSED